MELKCTSRLSANRGLTGKAPFAKLLILWVACLVAPVTAAEGDRRPPLGFAPDRILVMPKPDADLTELHAELGTIVLRSYPAIHNLQTIQLPAETTVQN